MIIPFCVIITFIPVITAIPKTCYSCFDGSTSNMHSTILKYFDATQPETTFLPFGYAICRKPRTVRCNESCVGIKMKKNDPKSGEVTTNFMGCSDHFDSVPDTQELKCTLRTVPIGYSTTVKIEYCTCGSTMCNDPQKPTNAWTFAHDQSETKTEKKESFKHMPNPTTTNYPTNSATTYFLGVIIIFIIMLL